MLSFFSKYKIHCSKNKYLDISTLKMIYINKNNRKFNFTVIPNGVEAEPTLTLINIPSNDSVKRILVKLTPYKWTTPFGFQEREINLYWNQPENHRNFLTAQYYKIEDAYGLVEVHTNSKLTSINKCGGNVTHYINYENSIVPSENPKYDVVVVLPLVMTFPIFSTS